MEAEKQPFEARERQSEMIDTIPRVELEMVKEIMTKRGGKMRISELYDEFMARDATKVRTIEQFQELISIAFRENLMSFSDGTRTVSLLTRVDG